MNWEVCALLRVLTETNRLPGKEKINIVVKPMINEYHKKDRRILLRYMRIFDMEHITDYDKIRSRIKADLHVTIHYLVLEDGIIMKRNKVENNKLVFQMLSLADKK